MKKTILRYALYSSSTICVLFLLSWFLGKDLNYEMQEVLGYTSMIISLSFIYFGIRYFRDQKNDGKIGLYKGLLIGVLISLLTALAFGILDMVYIKFINPDFLAEYYDATIEKMQTTLPPDELKLELAKMESQKELFSSPIMNFFIMFLTVFIIGFIISLISAFTLQRKN
ncbi:DUF4199 domain-containing protein [uncultured Kriegella sp.]|uniref:DUF4199 domain-containing protein n=1 Tax=uncultured Kriegella sp. TaxID=1798910 RepID=UPI0030DBADCA|tara:strand:+ start:19968 stop:20477 length:510 start_codon:yes stop_codon:yes gene_type:complete